ncbi:MAG: radical SAM protein [Candidatus Omnitrophica bacterium]|nr:radical SAM protein [Candidatus Omnitrophota bacterium]
MVKMKVILINPTSKFIKSHRIYRQFLAPIPPLGLAYIAAVLEKEGVCVELIDMFAGRISQEDVVKRILTVKPDIVGFSVLTPVLADVKLLVQEVKDRGIKTNIVLGNTHASCFSTELLNCGCADIVVRGEGELAMAELCRALVNGADLSNIKGISYISDGKVHHNEGGNIVEDLDSLPYPAFRLLDLNHYREFPMNSVRGGRFLPIGASRGCPYDCYFCAQDTINKKVRYRKMKQVVDEIEYMHTKLQVKYFGFTDAYFPFSESTGLEFCEHMVSRGLHKKIKWFTENRVDKVNRNLLLKMKEAGLHQIMYGIETGSQEVLDKINKKTTIAQAREAVKYTKEAKILSLGLYVLGLPGETREQREETIRFAKELDTDIAKFNIIIPYPGSQFFNDQVAHDRIDDPEKYSSWYSTFCFDFGITNHRQLIELQRRAMVAYYFRPNVIFRFFKMGIASYKNIFFGASWLCSMVFFSILEKPYMLLKRIFIRVNSGS